MCVLSDQQLSIVIDDVKNSGINFSHLDADLIDHICCDIESQMTHQISFDEAYNQVKAKFDIKGLRQIQQDTLMLIDKNYRIMKKSMKTIGVLAMSLMALGAIFKIQHWPGASIMLAVSFIFTTLVFFPSLLFVVYKETNQKKNLASFVTAFIGGVLFMSGVLFKIMHWPYTPVLLFLGIVIITFVLLPIIMSAQLKKPKLNKATTIIGFISAIILMSGMLFKLNHWPGATILLIAGSSMFMFLFAPMFIKKSFTNIQQTPAGYVFTIIAISYFIFMSFLLAVRTQSAAMPNYFEQQISYNASLNYLSQLNAPLKEKLNNEQANNIVMHTDSLIRIMEQIKATILQINYSMDYSQAMEALQKGIKLEYEATSVKYLLPENNAYSPLPALLSEFETLTQAVNAFNDSIPDFKIKPLFDTSAKLFMAGENGVSWADYNFKSFTAPTALSTLTFWQYNLALLQNQTLNTLNAHLKK